MNNKPEAIGITSAAIVARPRILITTGRRNEPALMGDMQNVTNGVNINYINAVVRAGGAPLLMPCVADPDAIEPVVAIVQGVLLTGGGDVLSLAYGQQPHPKSLYQNPVRDTMELAVVRFALARNIPILGVCRGIQLLNVALGGTLIQDIPSQVPHAILHYAQPQHATPVHTVDIEPGTRLAQIVGGAPLPVNTYHHQAVDRLGDGLRVNCRATDGVIEGVEATDGRAILGIQFHPEEVADGDARAQALFNWLVSVAIERR